MKKKMLNICFMGNPKFALKTLDILYNDENFNIKLVVTSKDKKRSRGKVTPTPVKKLAGELNLAVETPDSVNTKEFIDTLDRLDIDFIVVVAFGQLIKEGLLEKYKDRIINLHPSDLPKYRGASPIQFSLLNGESTTAASTMLIEAGMDSGDILIKEYLDIQKDDNYTTLESKLSELGAYAIRDTLLNFDKVYKERIKQDDNKATYCTKISKQMGKINWKDSSFKIINQIRALNEYPKAYFLYDDVSIKVLEAEVCENLKAKPGEVLYKDPKNLIVIGTGDFPIKITKLQYPGKKAMDTKSFLMGNTIQESKILINE